MDATDDSDPITEAIHQLQGAGWSLGVGFQQEDSAPAIWIVSGSNGENLIRAEAPTPAEAWAGAVEQARLLGMLRD